jgi:hypothetical protein
MNPFIQAAIDITEKSMDDVGRKLDEMEDGLRQSILSFDYETFKGLVEQLGIIHNTLVSSVNDAGKNFQVFINQMSDQDPNRDLYYYDLIRPMIYKIERIREILNDFEVKHEWTRKA